MPPRRPVNRPAPRASQFRLVWSVVLAAAMQLAATTVRAQVSDPSGGLTLDRALETAYVNNPAFRAQQNDLRAVDWDVRSAYAQLFPSASVGGGVSWQGAGEQRFGSLTLGQLGFTDQPSYLFSNYNLSLSWSLDGAKLLAPSEALARRDAAGYHIEEGEGQLRLQVTQAYLDALRQEEGVVLAEAQRDRALYNLQLARAQEEVGVGLALDTRRAEVEVGRSEIAVLQASNARDAARIQLFTQMGGVPDPGTPLATTLAVEEPFWEEETLVDFALAANPSIRELYAIRQSSGTQVRIARSRYFPTLSVSAGWSGFTREASNTAGQESRAVAGAETARLNCLADNEIRSRLSPPLPAMDCSRFNVSEHDLDVIRTANDRFPFDFVSSPPGVSVAVSLPIFQGLTRKRQVEAATVAREDAREQLRAREIALSADVRTTLGTVRTAYQSARLEERNRDLADEQLRMARERYAVGELPFAELVDAETGKAQADRDLVGAIFAYHDAVALLESLVGSTLR